MASLRASVLACAGLVACTMDGDVQNRGSYAFLPDGDVPDTAARPLRKLLIIDEDPRSATRLYYYFEGDLGALGLGVPALPRVLLRDGQFADAFDPPLATYTDEDDSEGGAGGGAPATPAGSVTLDANGTAVVLRPLEAGDLARVGAARFTSALANGQDTVRAYFGAEEGAVPLRQFVLQDDGAAPEGALPFVTEIAPALLELSLDEEGLAVEAGPLLHPDYLVVELFQDLERVSYAQELEAILRLTLPKGASYVARPALLASAFSALCWSADEPLFARVVQVARTYRSLAAADVAVIHRLANVSEAPPELWTHAIQPATPPGYCADFR